MHEYRQGKKNMETTNRLIKLDEVRHLVPFSRAKIYQLIKEKKFPQQLKEGGSSLWKMEDILSYIKNLGEKGKQNDAKNLEINTPFVESWSLATKGQLKS